MHNLKINDFECTNCGLPSSPGVCLHCRVNPNRFTLEPSEKRHYAILIGIGLISLLVLLYGFWMAK